MPAQVRIQLPELALTLVKENGDHIGNEAGAKGLPGAQDRDDTLPKFSHLPAKDFERVFFGRIGSRRFVVGDARSARKSSRESRGEGQA